MVLFIDVKRVFDHIVKNQLIFQMLELEIDGNLIYWTKSFLIDSIL